MGRCLNLDLLRGGLDQFLQYVVFKESTYCFLVFSTRDIFYFEMIYSTSAPINNVYSSLVAHLAAVSATRVRFPASCQILHRTVHKVKTPDGERTLQDSGNNKKFFLKYIFFSNFVSSTVRFL